MLDAPDRRRPCRGGFPQPTSPAREHQFFGKELTRQLHVPDMNTFIARSRFLVQAMVNVVQFPVPRPRISGCASPSFAARSMRLLSTMSPICSEVGGEGDEVGSPGAGRPDP